MIELTPLDVRKKKGDFRRGLRGYEPALVDDFLDVVADRMEVLVREAAGVGDKIARLEQQVADYRDREKALTEALVTAQQMREDMKSQSRKEVELLQKQAEQEAASIRTEAVRAREREEESLQGLRVRQLQFITSYKAWLEQEIADIVAIARGIDMHVSNGPSGPTSPASSGPTSPASSGPTSPAPSAPTSPAPSAPTSSAPSAPTSPAPSAPTSSAPSAPTSSAPSAPSSPAPTAPSSSTPSARSSPGGPPTAPQRPPAANTQPAAPTPRPSPAAAGATRPAPRAVAPVVQATAATAPPAAPPIRPVSPAPVTSVPAATVTPGSPRRVEPSAAALPAPAAPASAADESGGWEPDLMMEDEEPEQAVAHEAEAESDDLDEQLEEALARWEPRLESKDRSPAATEPEELVLSDDDVINGSSTPEPATPDDDELDDIMDFLDLADEPVESAAPSANGQGHDSNGLSDRKSSGVTTSVGGPADDDDYVELSAMLAEDLEEDEPEPPEATDETGMTAGPQEQTDQRSHEPSFAEAESEFPDDSEFFGVGRDAGKAEARGEFADPFSSEGGEGNDDLIDLDSMGPITRYEPASGGVSDTSTLTLHPMFFDQDAPDLPGGSEAGGMDKDHDGWITR